MQDVSVEAMVNLLLVTRPQNHPKVRAELSGRRVPVWAVGGQQKIRLAEGVRRRTS